MVAAPKPCRSVLPRGNVLFRQGGQGLRAISKERTMSWLFRLPLIVVFAPTALLQMRWVQVLIVLGLIAVFGPFDIAEMLK